MHDYLSFNHSSFDLFAKLTTAKLLKRSSRLASDLDRSFDQTVSLIWFQATPCDRICISDVTFNIDI